MSTRKWLIRSLIPAMLGLFLGGAYYVSALLRPSHIREELLDHLRQKFPGVDVEVGSAHLRFFGGISVTDLTIIPKNDPEHRAILTVPTATIQPDKENLSKGRLVVRKIVMDGASILVRRERDGTVNWSSVMAASQENDDPLPVFVLRKAKVRFEDRSSAAPRDIAFELAEVTAVNDPISTVAIEGRGACELFGPLSFQARYNAADGDFSGAGDLASFAIDGPQLAWLAGYLPVCGEDARLLRGRGELHFAVSGRTRPSLQVDPVANFTLKAGSFRHPQLPLPLDEIELGGSFQNGILGIAKGTANAAGSPLTFAGTFAVPEMALFQAEPAIAAPLDRVRQLNVALNGLRVGPDLFRRLPASLGTIQTMFQPVGLADVDFRIARENGRAVQRLTVTPRGLAANYEEFRYPVSGVRGTISTVLVPGRPDETRIDLTAGAKGRPVTVRGTVEGLTQKPEMAVHLTITGDGIEADEDLIAALPDQYPALVRRLRPKARGSFTATIKHDAQTRRDHGREGGPIVFDNTFNIQLVDSSLNYRDFPYPLTKVNGKLLVRTLPDRPTRLPETPGMLMSRRQSPPEETGSIEFKDFTAEHSGAKLKISGKRNPSTGGNLLSFEIDGENVPFDLELREALSRLSLDPAWQAFDFQGRMNCRVLADVFERTKTEQNPNPPFVPAKDLALSFSFGGPTIKPAFMPYLLKDVRGQLRYFAGKIDLWNFEARHGPSLLKLPRTEVTMRPEGGYIADFRDATMSAVQLDEELLRALPPSIRSGIERVGLRGGLAVQASRIVVDSKGEPPPPSRLPVARENVPNGIRLASYRSADPDFDDEQTPYRSPAPKPWPILPTISWDGSVTMDDCSFTVGLPWKGATGHFATLGRYEGDRPGAITAKLVLDRASGLGQPVENVLVNLSIRPEEPNTLIVDTIRANLYGGEIGGEARVLLEADTRFDLVLNAAQMKLSKFGQAQHFEAKTKLEGLAAGRLHLFNFKHADRANKPLLEGIGGFDIDNGAKILDVPELLNVFKALKLRVPDGTFFDEAHALFRIRGERLYFGQIDLLGEAVNLGGEGGLNLDGSGVKLEFYTMSRLHDLMQSPLSRVTAAMSRGLLKINVKGDIGGAMEYKAQAVPLVTDPLKRWFSGN